MNDLLSVKYNLTILLLAAVVKLQGCTSMSERCAQKHEELGYDSKEVCLDQMRAERATRRTTSPRALRR